MKLFQNEQVLRILRPAAAVLGFLAAVWHGTHALSAWRQSREWKTLDPSASAYFWSAFQTELTTAIVSLFAGVVAWHLFKPRQRSSTP